VFSFLWVRGRFWHAILAPNLRARAAGHVFLGVTVASLSIGASPRMKESITPTTCSKAPSGSCNKKLSCGNLTGAQNDSPHLLSSSDSMASSSKMEMFSPSAWLLTNRPSQETGVPTNRFITVSRSIGGAPSIASIMDARVRLFGLISWLESGDEVVGDGGTTLAGTSVGVASTSGAFSINSIVHDFRRFITNGLTSEMVPST